MAILEKDAKLLWGLAAGRCSNPGCNCECAPFLDAESPTIIGEMAHIVAKRPGGPRGVASGGSDKYDNLILLCPTHHTEVDKASDGTFPEEMLLEWKEAHEQRVREALRAPEYSSASEVACAVQRLLLKNHQLWKTLGPESPEAIANPISNAVRLWELRKVDTIVPNNRSIVDTMTRYEHYFDLEAIATLYEFETHAEGFEASCYDRVERGGPY